MKRSMRLLLLAGVLVLGLTAAANAAAISLASVNGLVMPGRAIITLLPIGTRSKQPHKLHQRPAHDFARALGAPCFENVARMDRMPSNQKCDQPSAALVSTEIARSRPGSAAERVMKP